MIAAIDLERARQKIRQLRNGPNRTDEIDALHLAEVIDIARPGMSMMTVAQMCGYPAADAIFFAELRELAKKGGTIRRDVVRAAVEALRGTGKRTMAERRAA